MKNLQNIIALFTILLFLNSCGDSAEQKMQNAREDSAELTSSENIEKDVVEENVFVEDIGEREPTDDEIREFGIIKNIEDGIYPMFIFTIEFPGREFQMEFNLNMEFVNMEPKSIDQLLGQYASFYYLIEEENDLMDIQFNGKSLMEDHVPEMSDNWRKVSGVLSGAEKETLSDLPANISITSEQGEEYHFFYYVDTPMLKANGKEVTVFYIIHSSQKISYLRVSKN